HVTYVYSLSLHDALPIWLVALLAALAMVLAACGGGEEPAETTQAAETTVATTPDTTEATPDTTEGTTPDTTEGEEPTADVTPIRACQVTDTGGIDARSFNQPAWKAAQDPLA